MAKDKDSSAHQDWLGFVQPVGLVVSPVALEHAGVFPNQNIVEVLDALKRVAGLAPVEGDAAEEDHEPQLAVTDFAAFACDVLGWEKNDLLGAPGAPALPSDLDVAVPEFEEVLAPTYAVRDPDHADRWLLLIQVLPAGRDLDRADTSGDHTWHAPAQARFERLLREREVPIGVLANGTGIRLVYAPRGESSGHVTFPVHAMCEVGGRPILSALHMLLSAERLFTLPAAQRLPALLSNSRKFQNEVSTALAEQVFDALNEFVRGFQAANEATKGQLLGDVLRAAPNEVYGGLLSVLLRLVFVLYAEERGLLSGGEVFQEGYSVTGLFERLREDAGRYPDLMDQRYGAWAQILTLFRLLYDGAAHGPLRLPARHGRLFDPDAHPFLEGRPRGSMRQAGERLSPPRVSDGVVWRVLQNLLILKGERLSYRTLDVEQIGSVYEAMMGYALEVAQGPSLGLKPDHVVVNLKEVLALAGAERAKALKKLAGCDVPGEAAQRVKAARTVDDLAAALAKQTSKRKCDVLPAGAMYLQPTEERRRSGSHYTPRSLTEPIVRTTLTPILERLGARPRPEQILDLKVCDLAMGSGALLVEACRFLGDALLRAWAVHKCMPKVPPDEDPQLYARRLVAQRCLYGVDKNPFAVDLAKLSLWLVTLAQDHPFTFLDHALRCGDSLVGLTRAQIAAFHWAPEAQAPMVRKLIEERLKVALDLRARIHAHATQDETAPMADLLAQADAAAADVRLVGDAVVAAFFGADKDKARKGLLAKNRTAVEAWLTQVTNPARRGEVEAVAVAVGGLRSGDHAVPPFHWEIEFPEVFARDNGGFDAFVGNPPFAGKNTLRAAHHDEYLPWLQTIHEASHGNADLVAHFYRRAFNTLRAGGAFGLVATKTIAQGDTRATGLRWICTHGGNVFAARKRLRWPGAAAVVVSVVHVAKGMAPKSCVLDGREVERITAFLFHRGGHDDPAALQDNAGKSFQGSIVLGMGFTFDDGCPEATSLAEMERLTKRDRRNRERIFPYIGGEEVNDSPTHAHRRYVINFGEMSEAEARKGWPDLMAIVEAKVKPKRMTDNRDSYRRYWWQFAEKRAELFKAIRGLKHVMVVPRTSQYLAVVRLPTTHVFSENLVVFAIEAEALPVLHSRVHGVWVQFTSSTLEDRQGYRPSDCFETFPFPAAWESSPTLEASGRAYYDFRAALMVKNNQGLTATYNRFHDPDETDPEIVRLRDLHAAMDRAVLDAYGWTDLQPTCEFLQDFPDADADNDSTDAAPAKNPARKKYRYRWPDDLRDEVLGRLLELNRQRAEAEAVSAALPKSAVPSSPPALSTRAQRPRKKSTDRSASLWPEATQE